VTSKIIVYAWVNDENTKRAFESKDDAYRVFSKMLKQGHPPDDLELLVKEAKAQSRKQNKDISRGNA
jgi:toxin YhaV